MLKNSVYFWQDKDGLNNFVKETVLKIYDIDGEHEIEIGQIEIMKYLWKEAHESYCAKAWLCFPFTYLWDLRNCLFDEEKIISTLPSRTKCIIGNSVKPVFIIEGINIKRGFRNPKTLQKLLDYLDNVLSNEFSMIIIPNWQALIYTLGCDIDLGETMMTSAENSVFIDNMVVRSSSKIVEKQSNQA